MTPKEYFRGLLDEADTGNLRQPKNSSLDHDHPMNYRGPTLFRHDEVCMAGPSSSVNEVQDKNNVLPSS